LSAQGACGGDVRAVILPRHGEEDSGFVRCFVGPLSTLRATMSRGDGVRRLSVAALVGLALADAGCGSAGRVAPKATPQPSMPAHSVVAGPCSSVRTTTPIEDVPAACAALWQPYGVTKVPPPDILQQEHVPSAPPVRNMTNGAVPDSVAQHWADASNWESGWLKWAEANDQPGLLTHLSGGAVIGRPENAAMHDGATIAQHDCNLYPLSNALYRMGEDGAAYFARKGLQTDDAFVLVAVYGGPCEARVLYPDGRQSNIPELSATTTALVSGVLRSDPVLGDIWFPDAGGSCIDPAGPPRQWCSR